MSRLGLALVGCGRVVEWIHLPALAQVPAIQLRGLLDLDRDRAAALAQPYGVAVYPDLEAVLADPGVAAVAVCVPVRHHFPVAERVLRGGRHLFVEKPLSLSLPECDQLVALAAEQRSRAVVGFHMRWLDRIQQARPQLPRLGRLDQLQSVFTSGDLFKSGGPVWEKTRATGGGVFIEEGVHHFDLWRHLLGVEVEEVQVHGYSEGWDDLLGCLTARLSNGAIACALFSNATCDANELTFYGRAGRLRVWCYRVDGLELTLRPESTASLSVRLRSLAWGLRNAPMRLRQAQRGPAWMAPYVAQWRDFAAGGGGCASLADGREAVRISLAAARSAEQGGPVRLAQLS